MAENKYKGSLSLDWYNKQMSIILDMDKDIQSEGVKEASIQWINKHESLFFEIEEEEGKGLTPIWVDRNDIRVKETRPLVFQKSYRAIPKHTEGKIEGTDISFDLQSSDEEDTDTDNMLIKGDNLLALNALKKHFANKDERDKVKCIYIDPPYNTGSAFEHYDDNIAHSEWLTLMRDRLVILKSLLREDGSIWISIDADESHYLKVLCDEIFGRKNFIEEVVWQRAYSPINLKKTFSRCHDYILVYAKNLEVLDSLNGLPRSQEAIDRYKNPDEDPRGPWQSGDLSVGPVVESKVYPITTPSGKVLYPPKGYCWRVTQERLQELIADNRIWFGEDGNNVPRIKRFLSEVKGGVVPMTLWHREEVGDTQESKKEVKALDTETVFETPKPERLLERVLHLATEEGDLVLDCFGGSGTTFAVAHKMNRRWIGIELGGHADTHIITRMNGVLDGSDEIGISQEKNWTGGGAYNYYHLGESIIKIKKDGMGDFNWAMGSRSLEESLLSSYGYEPLELEIAQPSISENVMPLFGIQYIGSRYRIGLFSLRSAEEDGQCMSFDDITYIYKIIKSQYKPEFINIFTNRGLELVPKAKPKDLDIIKVPQAIFANLQR